MSSDNSKNMSVTVGSIKVRVVKDVITKQQVRQYQFSCHRHYWSSSSSSSSSATTALIFHHHQLLTASSCTFSFKATRTVPDKIFDWSYRFPKVDVIVNSSNCRLELKKGRASKALLDAAGDVIQTECDIYPNGIQNGEIAITSGGQLSCKAIYHGALSKYSGPQDEQVNCDNLQPS